MNKFIIGGIVAALVVAAVALNRNHTTVDAQAAVLPELRDRLNDVTRLRIQSGDDTVTLVRNDNSWTVGERDYPAKLGQVRQTLIGLAEAKVFEPKTSNPALYERLGVQDFGTGEDDNTQVLLWAGDTQLSGLLVGDNATQPSGTYVRVVGQPQSALVTPRLSLSIGVAAWLQPELTNIQADDIQRIEAEPLGSAAYVIARGEDGLTLQNPPADRAPKPASVSRVTRVLQNLRLDDVLPAGEAPAVDAWNRLVLTTSDGLRVALELAEDGSRKLLKLKAGTAPLVEAADAKPEAAEADAIPPADRAAALNAKADGRVFVIQGYKFNDATLDLEFLLEAAAEE